MTTQEEVFRLFVEKVLNVWSGYQIALDNLCGGDDTSEKSKWLIDVITEYVAKTQSLKVDDFEEWLTNILYHDFDLILEDDSVYHTCLLFLEAFGYIKNNNEAGFQQLLSGLPSEEQIATAKRESVRGAENEEMEMDDIPYEDEQQSSEPAEYRPKQVKEVDEDGWTTIVER